MSFWAELRYWMNAEQSVLDIKHAIKLCDHITLINDMVQCMEIQWHLTLKHIPVVTQEDYHNTAVYVT